MPATTNPISQYFDLDGSPLDSGRLFFGEPGGNPITAPITVYWDEAETQPAAQPIPLLNGFPARAGSPAILYCSRSYSLLVRDRFGRQVFYARDSAEFGDDGAVQLRQDLANGADDELGAGLVAYNATLVYPAGSVGAALAAAGSGTGGTGSAMPTVRDDPFNATGNGTTPDQAAFFAAATASPQFRVPPGTYRFSATTIIAAGMAMDAGAVISADAGVQVTIAGPLEAGRSRHFTGAGTFVFAPGSVENVNAEWMGLSPTATEAENNAALLRAWVAGFGTGVTVGRGRFPLGDVTLKAFALSNTSQMPNFLVGAGVDGNGGSNSVDLGVGTTFFGPSARIHVLNDASENSNAKIQLRGFHVVGPNDDTAGVGGIKATKVSDIVVERVQTTGSRGNGGEFIDCYGAVIEDSTFLRSRQHGILCNRRFNQAVLRNNKCIANGKDYTGIYGNITFSGGPGLESLGPVIENNDTSYAGTGAILYKRTNPSPSARSITITNVVVAGGTATATTAAAHGRATGDFISVFGVTADVRLNTVFTPQITVTSATAFTWTTTADDDTYTDATMVIGPAAYGASFNDIRGAKITTYAEDCVGVAVYMGINANGCDLKGGYDQGLNVAGGGSGIILLDNPSNINVSALSLSGPNSILRVAASNRKHGINIDSTVTVENGAEIQYGGIELRDGQYYASAAPTGGTWRRGDWVQNLNAAPGSPQGWYCSAAPNTFEAIDAAAGGGISLPAQAGNAGRVLGTDGTTASWVVSASALPSQTGNAGKYLGTDGTTASWSLVTGGSLPSQTGNAGRFLTTDGTNATWTLAPAGTLPAQAGNAGRLLTTDGTSASWATNATLSNLTVTGGATTATLNVTSNASVAGTLTGNMGNFAGALSGSSLTVGGNISGSTLNLGGGASVSSLSVTSGGANIIGGSTFSAASGNAATFNAPSGGTGLRVTTSGGGSSGMTIDGSAGGVALYVIGALRLDPGTSSGSATASTAVLAAKPGASTNGVWFPVIKDGVLGDMLWWPRA